MPTCRQPIRIAQCRQSRFSARRTWSQEHVDEIAALIEAQGEYDPDCPIGVVKVGDTYEVVWGIVRLEAVRTIARKKGTPDEVATIPAVIHEGFSDDELVRFAVLDNAKQAAARPVPFLDICAEYRRLAEEEGWTQDRIAEARRWDFKNGAVPDKSRISNRIGISRLPSRVQEMFREREGTAGALTEEHLVVAMRLNVADERLLPWQTTEELQLDFVNNLCTSDGFMPSIKETRNRAAGRKRAMEAAGRHINATPLELHPQLLQDLRTRKAATRAAVEDACNRLLARPEASATVGEHEAQRARAAVAAVDEALECVRQGDCTMCADAIPEGIRLVLMDPPYGMGIESRSGSVLEKRVDGDATLDAAIELFRKTLTVVTPKMLPHSWLIVFTRWKEEHAFVREIETAGFVMRNSCIWNKMAYSAGNTAGAFAFSHERILVAVKGNPMRDGMRLRDVFSVPRPIDPYHPTQKPQALLEQLILATTDPGELVFDPMAGSGSTVFAALATGRRAFAIEKSEKYVDRIRGELLETSIVSTATPNDLIVEIDDDTVGLEPADMGDVVRDGLRAGLYSNDELRNALLNVMDGAEPSPENFFEMLVLQREARLDAEPRQQSAAREDNRVEPTPPSPTDS